MQSIPDLNDSIDVSNISQDSNLSTASTMATKKGGRPKGRSTRTKKAEPIEVVETSPLAAEEDVTDQPDVICRGKKRKSEEISDDNRGERESTIKPDPQPKRRATRSRKSETPQTEYPVLSEPEAAKSKPGRGGRKRGSSSGRKISTGSAATMASLRATIPDDAEIEAALEADLDQEMPDQFPLESEIIENPKPKGKGRPKRTKASTAPARSKRQTTADSEASQKQVVGTAETPSLPEEGKKAKLPTKTKVRKTHVAKKKVDKGSATSGRASNESAITFLSNAESHLNSSPLTAQTTINDSGHETDASVASQRSATKKGTKRKAGGKAKGKKTALTSKNIEDIVQTKTTSQALAEANPLSVYDSSLINVEKSLIQQKRAEESTVVEQPKRVTRATKGGKVKANTTIKAKSKTSQLSMPGMFSPLMGDIDPSFNSVLANSSPPIAPVKRSGLGADQRIPATLAVGSSPVVVQRANDDSATPIGTTSTPAEKQTCTPRVNKNTNEATPSPSPQSSDAENQPPSSRPPSTRPPLASLSPLKGAMQRIPLAPDTPRQVPLSPSKIGGLRSEMPWTAIDVEMIFAQSPDKENCNIFTGLQKHALTSPEKAMSVEEWIKAQAGGAEEKLKAEAERVVSIFEREGGRALGVLEGIEVVK